MEFIIRKFCRKIRNLQTVDYIWISHEHPDHFSIKFIKDYEKVLKKRNIKFIFQKTKDKRLSLFKKMKFETLELENNKLLNIDKNFSLKIQKCDFYDSALILKVNDKTIFNINDCPLKSKSDIEGFKKKYGQCDYLFTQFSYAAWKGGKNNSGWRDFAAREKIQTLKNQSEIFGSKFTIPFASFIKFSDNYNNYLNDSINTPNIIIKKCKDLIQNNFLEPYQIFDLDNPKEDTKVITFGIKFMRIELILIQLVIIKFMN